MLPHPATNALNHVLRSTPVAMERLARYAGKTASFHVGLLKFTWTVQTTGEVTAAIPGVTPDLEVRISPFLLPRLAMHDEAAYREPHTHGGDPSSIAFCEEVGLNYVSCSPYRVPIARLAAAQAAIAEREKDR